MGHHCCNKQKVKRGLWSPEEDEKLIRCITTHGHGCWSSVPKLAGLQRCGKSCRLRWINYLRPDLKRGSFSAQEERIIIDVHRILGNRWAQIAKHLPGRTDNEVKNFWNSCIKKKLIAQGLDPKTHNLIPTHQTTSTINNNACNLNQIYQQPNSIFSIGDAFMNINPSFITLPPPPPPPPPPLHHYHPFSNIDHPQLHESMTINPTFDYQNPNLVWSSVKDNQNSLESTPMSSSSMNPSGIGILDENCLVGGSVDLFQTLRKEEFQQPPQQQHEKWCELEEFINETNEAMKDGQVMESTSFNSSSFDLEFMESTLMPCGMYSNISSMDQQLEWDY